MLPYLPLPQDLIPKEHEELWRILQQRLSEIAERAWSSGDAVVVPAGGASGFYSGTHAQRMSYPAYRYAIGTFFWETDRATLYMVAPRGAARYWRWIGGECAVDLVSKPADLQADDAGFLLSDPAFDRKWIWTGEAWEYAPAYRTSEVVFARTDPGAGWALANGAAGVTATKSNATTEAIALPNLIGAYPKGAVAYNPAQAAATAGTLSGSTGAGGAHAHTFEGFPLGAHQHMLPLRVDGAGNIAWQTGTNFGFGMWSTLDRITTGAAIAAAESLSLSAGESAGTPAGVVSSADNHTHPLSGSVAGAEPAHVDLLPYLRL